MELLRDADTDSENSDTDSEVRANSEAHSEAKFYEAKNDHDQVHQSNNSEPMGSECDTNDGGKSNNSGPADSESHKQH